jgi:predicted RNA-binding protein YlqC (UPF0109 family)
MSERIASGKPHYEAWSRQLRDLLQAIVAEPNDVWVEVDMHDRPPALLVHCAPVDIARVIGRYNRGIEALAVLTKTWSFRYDLPARIEVVGARRRHAENELDRRRIAP